MSHHRPLHEIVASRGATEELTRQQEALARREVACTRREQALDELEKASLLRIQAILRVFALPTDANLWKVLYIEQIEKYPPKSTLQKYVKIKNI